MNLKSFHETIRRDGRYVSPPDHRPPRPAPAGAWSAWRFYVGGLGSVISHGARSARRGTFDDQSLARLSFILLRAAERLGATVTCEGFTPLATTPGPFVFVANHMSLVETIMLPSTLMSFGPLSIVAKRSLTRYPWFGTVLCATQPILVSRHNARQDLHDVLTQGVEQLRRGRSILLFPQGTRAPCFDPRRFNTLGVKLAQRAGVTLVPVAVRTDFAVVGRWLRDFGPVDPSRPIRFTAGAPLPPTMPAREQHAACLRFITGMLSSWGLPLAASGEESASAESQENP